MAACQVSPAKKKSKLLIANASIYYKGLFIGVVGGALLLHRMLMHCQPSSKHFVSFFFSCFRDSSAFTATPADFSHGTL